MTDAELPRIWYATEHPDNALMQCLADAPAHVQVCCLVAEPPDGDAVVIDAEGDPVSALRLCRAVRSKFSEDTPPIVMLTQDGPTHRLPAYQAGADVCIGRPFAIEELLAQLRASLRWSSNQRRRNERSGQTREVNRELQQAYAQMSSEAEFASRLHASFAPLFPEVGQVRFAVHYRAHGSVGSDCCDAVRLDERHVGFWLADAMTHGVPAALLTAFLMRAVVGKELSPNGYRIVPPAEVLARLNCALLGLQLAEPPLTTMIYGVIDCFNGDVTMARAAHPAPVYVPVDGRPTVWPLNGTLLGMPGAAFTSETRMLAPGDRIVMVTDGLCPDPSAASHSRLLETIRDVGTQSLGGFAQMVADRLTEVKALADDATLFALEFQTMQRPVGHNWSSC
jgi:CheY-like chemotaxis protein